MKLLIFPIKYNFKWLLLINIYAILFTLMAVVIGVSVEGTYKSMQHIPRKDLYMYKKLEGSDMSSFDQIFSLDGNLDELKSYEVTLPIDQYNIEIPSFASYNLKSNFYQYSQNKFTPSLYANLTSRQVSNTNMPNPIYGIDQILTGAYPQEKNDILIGEYTAIGYLNMLNLNNYSDLIGQTITLKVNGSEYKYVISGVYLGGEALLTSPDNMLFGSYKSNLEPSYYRHFNSSFQKNKYIKENSLNESEYIDSSTNIVNFKFLVISILLVLLNVSYILLSAFILKNDYLVIKFYKQYKTLLLLVIPILNLLVLNGLYIKLITVITI